MDAGAEELHGPLAQRRRWARGLAQVLRRHGGQVLGSWKRRRMWPVAVEASLSILWAYCLVALTAVWALSYAAGVPPRGASPIPNWWGMVIASLAMIQLSAGVLLDRRYERGILRVLPVAVLYPVVYWLLMAAITAAATPRGLLARPRGGVTAMWRTPRMEGTGASEERARIPAGTSAR